MTRPMGSLPRRALRYVVHGSAKRMPLLAIIILVAVGLVGILVEIIGGFVPVARRPMSKQKWRYS